jgi:hypothetical protein
MLVTFRWFQQWLKSLELNWVTFEDIFEKVEPALKNIDITNVNDAYEVWEMMTQILNK